MIMPFKNTPFKPRRSRLWAILNASHIGLDKIIEEFVDNALSAGSKRVLIRLSRESDDRLRLTVADSGPGIAVEDLDRVFGVGYAPDETQAGAFNQFGVGMKSALASCDAGNSEWALFTSTDGQQWIRVGAPYREASMEYTICDRSEVPLPAGQNPGSGTLIVTPVPHTLFRTCAAKPANDQECIDALIEELRVTYAFLLDRVELILEWAPLGGPGQRYVLEPLCPEWTERSVQDQTEIIDLGNGALQARYSYGKIRKQPDHYRYFRGNITSSGLMVFLNGRLIQFNIFEDVWAQPHPQYNNFLFQVDLSPVNNGRDALPLPRPDKDKMVLGDPRFEALTEWVRKLCPSPRAFVKQPKGSHEARLRNMLSEKLKALGAAVSVLPELPMMEEHAGAARSDLYARMADGRAVLYEAKAGRSKVLDLSQLATYALLAMEGGLVPDELVLVAARHNPAVKEFAAILERRWFRDRKVPVIRLLTWAEVEEGTF